MNYSYEKDIKIHFVLSLFWSDMLNKPFPSSPGPLYQNEVKCSAFELEMIFHSHANKTHFHKKGCALGLILKLRGFRTRKWPIVAKELLLVFFSNSSPVKPITLP